MWFFPLFALIPRANWTVSNVFPIMYLIINRNKYIILINVSNATATAATATLSSSLSIIVYLYEYTFVPIV